MQVPPMVFRRFTLREFVETDRAAFITYQTDPRYRQLYDFDDNPERPSQLLNLFLQWQREQPRLNIQLAICETATGKLLGSAGLRKVDNDAAVLGIELAPAEWGRFRLALDTCIVLLGYGFETLNLAAVVGSTASGNWRVEKLARRFGARVVARRSGPDWMQARRWQEVDWEITRDGWGLMTSAAALLHGN
ncbi:GNAT family N-acetyltransferase [Agrobacterium sp.]|uniref:GNAT family N-acetyltransferase n=2 Tax=Alphaproteobacteria TaxID=28211 RepID=UPI0040344E21